jgi:hypothetical protein
VIARFFLYDQGSTPLLGLFFRFKGYDRSQLWGARLVIQLYDPGRYQESLYADRVHTYTSFDMFVDSIHAAESEFSCGVLRPERDRAL